FPYTTLFRSQVSPLLSKIALNPNLRSVQACSKLAFAFSGISGFGIYTNSNALIATTAPIISNNNTFPIDIKVIAKAPNAGPAIAEIDCIIWLTPAMRNNSLSGAIIGIDACIAGMWNADPTDRKANIA